MSEADPEDNPDYEAGLEVGMILSRFFFKFKD